MNVVAKLLEVRVDTPTHQRIVVGLGVLAYLLEPFGFERMRDTLQRYAQYRQSLQS